MEFLQLFLLDNVYLELWYEYFIHVYTLLNIDMALKALDHLCLVPQGL